MKTIKFLAAMAIPAMFAACTNEEIIENTPQKMQEVIGAELIGTDISLSVSMDGDVKTRYAGGISGFDAKDTLGLAWVPTSTSSGISQDNGAVAQSVVYANNMFDKAEGENLFTTKGNIYKGYHFVYAPYVYEESVGEKTFTVNPGQTVGYTDETLQAEAAAAYNKMLANQFQMSAFHYLTKGDLDKNQLTKQFKLKTPLNQLVVKTTADGVFNTNEALKEYAIKYVKFNMQKKVFVETAKIDATKLYVWDEGSNDNETALAQSFKDAVVNADGERVRTITTNVKDGIYKVSDVNPRIMTFVLPLSEFTNNDKNQVSIEVGTSGGKFVIKYDADVNTANATNNAAIEALAGAFAQAGKFSKGKCNQQLTLNLVLREADFETEYMVSDYPDWVECVTLANNLESDEVEFVLADDAHIEFNSQNPMIAPNGNLTLKSAGNPEIVIADEVAWPANIVGAVLTGGKLTVKVEENSVLLLNSELRGDVKIINNGTIKAESNAWLGSYLINNNEVVVALGAKVSQTAEQLGKISYRVPLNYDLEAIQTLKASAQVNNLVIGKGFELNCASPLTLDNVHLEINGGVVTSEGYAVTAGSVTMAGGSIVNVDVLGDVIVKEGDNANSYAGELNVEGNVTVDAKADLLMSDVSINEILTNNGKVQISADLCTTIRSIVNNGTLNATTDVYVETITLGESSATTIASGKTIWYSSNDPEFKQNGTTSGKIEYYNTVSKFADDLAAAKAGDVVVLMKNETITDCSVIKDGVIIKGLSKDYKLTIGGDKQMKFANNVVIENLTIVGTTSYEDAVAYTAYDKYILFAKDATLNNVVFETPVAVAGDATFNGCTFTGNDSYYMWIADYGKTINVNNCVFNSTRSITILDDFTVFGFAADVPEKSVNLSISGTTFNTTEKGAVMAGQAVTVTWGEGNVVPEGVVGKEVWIRYEYYENTPNNIQNVKVSGCGINIEGKQLT